MAKVNLYKIIKSFERNLEFRDKLRAIFEKLAPDTKLTRDDAFAALVEGLPYYKDRFVEVPDDCVEVKEK